MSASPTPARHFRRGLVPFLLVMFMLSVASAHEASGSEFAHGSIRHLLQTVNENCQVSAWSEFGSCSLPCGSGIQRASRTVLVPARGNGTCPILNRRRNCNAQPCPVNCVLSAWSSPGPCDATCGGGNQTSFRTITTQPQNGGTACGNLGRRQSCNTRPCTPNDVIVNIDCAVSAWSDWSPCDALCGGGSQRANRSIITFPLNRGAKCPGLNTRQECNTKPCAVDCKVSDWDPWTTCDATCGGGNQSQSRTITQEPLNGGAPCPQLSQIRTCNTEACTANTPRPNINCVVSDWSEPGVCDATCGGGRQVQYRKIVVQKLNDGLQCPDLVRRTPCNEDPCPVNCQVSTWSAFSACDAQCGGGLQISTRNITVQPAGTGLPCPFLLQTIDCNTQQCTGSAGTEVVNCDVSEWTDWSRCSATCNGGTQRSTREITKRPKNNGEQCPALVRQQQCNTDPCPVDCQVSSWSAYSACDATCGEGVQISTRNITVQTVGNGKPCPSLLQTKDCNQRPCTGDDALTVVNCGVSGWTDWSKCSASCNGGTQTSTRVITTRPKNNGEPCPNLERNQPCNTNPCPGDCVVSDYSEWSECSATCGGGTQTSTRTIVTPAIGLGKACPSLTQTRTCNPQPCPVDCLVTEWSDWGPCSSGKTCDGTQTQTRTVTRPAENGGNSCPPDLTQTRNCPECPRDCFAIAQDTYGPCVGTCGTGTRLRDFIIVQPPTGSGQPCPIESVSCQLPTVCPVDCVGKWGAWSTCDATCGSGVETQFYEVSTPAVGTGLPCPNPGFATRPCSGLNPCPVNCDGEWSIWGPCQASCGSSTQTRTWTTKTQPVGTGTACPTSPESRPCDTGTVCPVNCDGEWSIWGPCQANCGNSTQTRTWTTKTQPAGTGTACPTSPESQPCDTGTVCPPVYPPAHHRKLALYTAPCAGRWTDWSECMGTCGTGSQVSYTFVQDVPGSQNNKHCPVGPSVRSCDTGRECTKARHLLSWRRHS